MNNYQAFFALCESLIPILEEIKKAGGVSYLVGGFVRDLLLHKQSKDIDIEVHEISLEQLEKILSNFGSVQLVGKQFGVLLVSGLDIDWSIPRRDSKGRKPKVTLDPTMTIEQAARRRDLTINSIAINLNEIINRFDMLQKELRKKLSLQELCEKLSCIDPYDGIHDLQTKTLRAIDTHLFLEDPLRFFRVMQFIGRFEMSPDQELQELCKSMSLSDTSTQKIIAKERIDEEIRKLLLKSRRPSLGFRWLLEIKRLKELFPELHALVNIPQRKDFHPEGDVFEHTMQALDASSVLNIHDPEITKIHESTVRPEKQAPIIPCNVRSTCIEGMGERENNLDNKKLIIMLAVLCHDLGKAITTDEDLHCHGHAEAGESLAKSLLRRFTDDQKLIKSVCKLVRYHMHPISFLRSKAGLKSYKKLAQKLHPDVTIFDLSLAALADWRGRNPDGQEPLTGELDSFQEFLEHAKKAEVTHQAEAPVLLGRHLMGLVPPGPEMGDMLKKAYEIQIDEEITDIEELKRRVLK